MAPNLRGTAQRLADAQLDIEELGSSAIEQEFEEEEELFAANLAFEHLTTQQADDEAHGTEPEDHIRQAEPSIKKIKLSEAVAKGSQDIIVEATRRDYER